MAMVAVSEYRTITDVIALLIRRLWLQMVNDNFFRRSCPKRLFFDVNKGVDQARPGCAAESFRQRVTELFRKLLDATFSINPELVSTAL